MSDDKMSRFMARDPISAAMQVLHDDIMSRESLDEPTTSTSPVAVSEVHTLLLQGIYTTLAQLAEALSDMNERHSKTEYFMLDIHRKMTLMQLEGGTAA